MAVRAGGRLLLRIEDLDPVRSTKMLERHIVEDLDWLGVTFAEAPIRQSDNGDLYARALDTLASRDLIYPCHCSRADIARKAGGLRDPDGSPPHLGRCRPGGEPGKPAAWRLDMARALALAPRRLFWREFGEGAVETLDPADPAVWGDVALKRKDAPASYHLAVVVDDHAQGVSDVVRGLDLFHATGVHRLLQELLGLGPPRYRHHRLVRDGAGEKLSKSARSSSLAHWRDAGVSANQIRAALGFGETFAPADQLVLAAIAGPDGAGVELGAWAIN